MATAPQTAGSTIAIGVDGRIAEDRTCIRCGYNLRTQLPDGNCPECNATVADSLLGIELVHAPREWLTRIARGFTLMQIAMLVALAVFVSAIFLFALSSARWLELVFSLVTLLSMLMFFLGFLHVTSQEPRLLHLAEGWSARRWARVLVAAAILFQITLVVLRRAFTGNALIDFIMIYSSIVSGLLALAAAMAITEYLVVLLQRTAEQKITKNARQVRTAVRAIAIVVGLQLIVAAIIRAKPAYSPRIMDSIRDIEKLTHISSSCITLVAVLGGVILVCQIAGIARRLAAAARVREATPAPP